MNEWILPQGEAAALMPGASYSLPGLFLYSKLIYQCLDQVQDKFGYAIPVRYLYGCLLYTSFRRGSFLLSGISFMGNGAFPTLCFSPIITA